MPIIVTTYMFLKYSFYRFFFINLVSVIISVNNYYNETFRHFYINFVLKLSNENVLKPVIRL